MSAKPKPNTPWDQARSLDVKRTDPFGNEHELEPGVKYFILALERLGCVTQWSCEGHPGGFYIVFIAPYETALKIRRCGFFNVEVEGENKWSLRLPSPSATSEREKAQCLRWAAEAWERGLK